MTTLGPIGTEAFERRSIDPETAARFAIYTASRGADGDVIPDLRGNIIVFPFMEHGVAVNKKFRAPGKKFWQQKGGRKTFWNSDALDDPALESGQLPLIITEGELDALTAIESGFPLTVSVPDGAPPVPDGEEPNNLGPEDKNEQSGKFEYLWNNRDRLRRVKRVILAVDNDRPGKRLAAELVRRLSAARCFFVEYPGDCKDLNDVAMKHGRETVAAVLNGAKRYPVRGLYRLSEYPDLQELDVFETGWWTLDRHLRLWLGEFMMVIGCPNMGKSVFVQNLVVNLSRRYGLRCAFFSPEEPTVPQLRDKLRRLYLRRRPQHDRDRREADAWLEDRFVFIDTDPTGREDEDYDLEWLLERAADAVLRDGIQVLAIDPWNEIEHARRRDETMTEYHARAIRAVKRFARLYNVMVIVVAHPTKEVGKDGKMRPPTPYDTDGSAAFFNKADHFIIVHRPDEALPETVVRVAKVRFENTGEKGAIRMHFDRESGRFTTLDAREAA